MTALADILRRQIAADGPISVARYMAECLLHPQHGYYTTRPPFGVEGDFTTAPEMSQMFGELLGLCLAQYWLDLGRPPAFALAEFGPGRGTLMADILRATRGVPGFHGAASVVLIEASPRLRGMQAQALAPFAVQWVEDATALPDAPLLAVANEFFDALPVHQYLKSAEGWRERLVGLKDGTLAFGLSAPMPREDLDQRFAADPMGSLVEVCPEARRVMAEVAGRITRHGGMALFVDYGGWRSKGDTLQALRNHAFADPLAEPGMADLTAHVDFEALALAAPGLRSHYATQGQVLAALGIHQRAERLAQRLTDKALQNHLAALHRLTHPEEMGSLFKMLALTQRNAPTPPGFAPCPDFAHD